MVLRAEDDAIMRKLTRKRLEGHGYKVLEADSGKAALARIALDHGLVDLTLPDVVMKQRSGPEVVFRLLDSHPKMKVFCTSGYAGELMANQGLNRGIRLLEKPPTRASLLNTIDAALG